LNGLDTNNDLENAIQTQVSGVADPNSIKMQRLKVAIDAQLRLMPEHEREKAIEELIN
jgi:hypothetical protein